MPARSWSMSLGLPAIGSMGIVVPWLYSEGPSDDWSRSSDFEAPGMVVATSRKKSSMYARDAGSYCEENRVSDKYT